MEIGNPDITVANIHDLELSNWTKKIGTEVGDLSIWDKVLTHGEMVSWTTCRWGKGQKETGHIKKDIHDITGVTKVVTYLHG